MTLKKKLKAETTDSTNILLHPNVIHIYSDPTNMQLLARLSLVDTKTNLRDILNKIPA